MKGREVCYNHGGKSKRGIAHWNFKDGSRAKDLPFRMLGVFEASMNDPELLSLRTELSVVDGRFNDLLKRVDTREAGAVWRELNAEYNASLDALTEARLYQEDTVEHKQEHKRLMAKSNRHLRQIGTLLNQGSADYAAWNEITNIIEVRRKLVESERKRVMDMQLLVRAEEFDLFARKLIASVKRHVKDDQILMGISHDLAALIERG